MNPGLRPPPTLPNNVYFPGLPQLQRHPEPVGFNPSILSQTTPGGRRPKHGNKNDRCEFCGKVRFLKKFLCFFNFYDLPSMLAGCLPEDHKT